MTSTTTPAAEALGPQSTALAAAAATYETLLHGHGPEALRYDAAIDADWTAIEIAGKRAGQALEADGIDVAAVCDLGGCGWGFAALGLAARHLIGTTLTQADYDTLTRPWRVGVGRPMHPDD